MLTLCVRRNHPLDLAFACTICWYVDDNKVSHADPKVVESDMKEIEKEFNVELVIESGKKGDLPWHGYRIHR